MATISPSALKLLTILRVHVGFQIDHARDFGFGDDDVVQRFVGLHRFSVAHQVAMQHAPRHHALFAAERAFQLGIKLVQSDGGQETQAAQVHGKIGISRPRDRAGSGQQRSIAAQNDHQLRSFGNLLARQAVWAAEIARRFVIQPGFHAALAPPLHQIPT